MTEQELQQDLASVNHKLGQSHVWLSAAYRAGNYDDIKELAQTIIDLCDHAMHCQSMYKP